VKKLKTCTSTVDGVIDPTSKRPSYLQEKFENTSAAHKVKSTKKPEDGNAKKKFDSKPLQKSSDAKTPEVRDSKDQKKKHQAVRYPFRRIILALRISLGNIFESK